VIRALAHRAEDGGQGDVVDFRIRAPFGAARDSNFEFAREIVEVGIAAQFPVEREDDGRNVGDFMGVKSGERATRDVADDVAASAGGAQADGLQALENCGERFDLEPVELDVLAYRDVGDAVAVFVGKRGDGSELRGAEQAVGDANAEHKEWDGATFSTRAAGNACAIALRVDAPSAEVGGEPFGRDGIKTEAREFADFVKMVPGVFGAFEALDALGFGFLLVGHLVVSTTPQAAGPGFRIEKLQARRPELQQRTHYGGVKPPLQKQPAKKKKPACGLTGTRASKVIDRRKS